MTSNQIAFANLREQTRHNREQEKLTHESNKATKKHYQNQDKYTSEHYERSDTAGLISANAGAINAQAASTNANTNRKKYEMEYDIEYGWTGSGGYPAGMPLSAQQKSADIQTTIYKGEQERYSMENMPKKLQIENYLNVAKTLQSGSSAVNNVFNALYGKQGLLGALETIITE